MKLSLTWRARLLNGALSGLALVALVALAQSRIRAVLYHAVDEAVTSQAQTMIEMHKREPDQGPPEFRRPGGFGNGPDERRGQDGMGGQDGGRPGNFGPRRRGPGGPGFVIRFGSTALLPPRFIPLQPRAGEHHEAPWAPEGVAAAIRQGTDLREVRGPNDKILHVYSVRSEGIVLQTAADLDQTNLALDEIQKALYGLILPVGVLMALLGALLTDIAFSPIRKLTRAAAALQPTDLSGRLPAPGGGDTFDQLVTVLNAMLGRLEGAFVRQKRFTADASHELRTPLAVIKAATSFLLEGDDPLTERQRRTLSRADRTVDRANTLVSDLLLLARSENGTLTTQLETVELPELLSEAIRAAEAGQPSPHAPVLLEAEPRPLTTDPKLVHRLVVNLVSNALRHTGAEGRVTVHASLTDKFVLTIADTGEGIAAENLERLGEPFYRPDASRAREQGGVGLGLALCKEIVSTLGGELVIESTLGVGTTVRVSLPVGH
jgi:signal transduction histidine kinase